MAVETKTTASDTPVPVPEVVVPDVPAVVVVEKEATPPPQPEPEPEPEPVVEKLAAAADVGKEEKVTEADVAAELPEKKALEEFKKFIQEALNKHEFTAPPPPPAPLAKVEEKKLETEETAPPPPPAEELKTEEVKEVEVLPAVAEESPAPVTEEEPPKPEAETPAPAAEVETATVVEKAETVDDDGAKTVEEIKETIVEVTNSAPPATESAPPTAEEEKKEEDTKGVATEETQLPPEEVSIWGIPLLGDERSDTILLKFLRARDFKVKDAFTMLKNVVAWRKEFGIDKLLEEEGVGSGLEKVVFTHGVDKEGHPVCYNAYGELQDKELYQNAFTAAEKYSKFLRWRIQFLEKSIRKLDFCPDGISTIVQVNDLKNSPGLFLFKKEFRQATNQALQLLQDNYPEFVAKQVFINVPWWYVAYNRMISPFLTTGTKSKFVFAGPSKTADTLFKYIAPEQVPVQYGGLSKEGEQEFSAADATTEETIKPASKQVIEFPVTDVSTLVWETRVIGWDVSYGAEFVPSAEGSYTVIVQKPRKIVVPTDEPVITGSYKVVEPGKVVITLDNQTSKKKKVVYRSKTKTCD